MMVSFKFFLQSSHLSFLLVFWNVYTEQVSEQASVSSVHETVPQALASFGPSPPASLLAPALSLQEW